MMLNGYLLFTGSGGGGPVTVNQILLSDLEFNVAGEVEAEIDTAEVLAQVEGEAAAVVEPGEIEGEVDC